jgi:hypothetical protein
VTETNTSSAASEWCLADKSVLVSIAPARGGAAFPLALSAAIIGLWRDLQWPVVHFLPDYVPVAKRTSPGRGLIQPGALWFESETSSIWSCQRFCEFHEDIGGAPIVIIGGEIDKSVLSVAIGAVDRNVSAFYVPETAGMLMTQRHNDAAQNALLSVMSNFAIELTIDDLFDSLNKREEGNYAANRQLRP